MKGRYYFSYFWEAFTIRIAQFYQQRVDHSTICDLCNHRCVISEGNRGLCGVRENRKGILYSLVYGKLIAQAVDPIEKKPLFHFLPGSFTYSIATVGCNFRCSNCQNWKISQLPQKTQFGWGREVSVEEIVSSAIANNCKSIAYTYTEPVVFLEYVIDSAKLTIDNKLKTVFVTNGYITPETLKTLAPYLHAANIDLKSFNDEFYRTYCGARLSPILESIKLHKQLGIWIEITTLIIPGLNDSEENLRNIAKFIRNLDPNIPWHVSRFYPSHKLIQIPPTSVFSLREARTIGLNEGLNYVYVGNLPGESESTCCHHCGELLIERYAYQVIKSELFRSRCPKCGQSIAGVWE